MIKLRSLFLLAALVVCSAHAAAQQGIAPPDSPGCDSCLIYFRTSVALQEQPEQATAYITGPDIFFLSVNGTRAAQAQLPAGASATTAWDVTALLRQGENAVSVFAPQIAAQDNGSEQAGECGSQPLLADIVIRTRSGDTVHVATGAWWKVFVQEIACNDAGLCEFDAAQAPPLQTRPVADFADHAGIFMKYAHWQDADYDDTSWKNAREVKTRRAIDYAAAPAQPPRYAEFLACQATAGEAPCTPRAPGDGSPDSNGIPIPATHADAPSRTLFLATETPGMVSFRLFAREAGAVIVARGIGRYITRQGLQSWDLPFAVNQLEMYIEEPGGGVFLLDAGAWRAAP